MIRRTPLQRGSRLKPVSAKRARLNKIYSALRKKFLAEHPYCQWWLSENGFAETDVINVIGRGPVVGRKLGFRSVEYWVPLATDIHHTKGRGKYLLDVSTWMAVSRDGHNWIHAHPKESEEKGYIIRR